jgi:hypothetical protein
MIRSGDGKLKGRRNRRVSLAAQKDWRFFTRLFYVSNQPANFGFAAIQDALKW